MLYVFMTYLHSYMLLRLANKAETLVTISVLCNSGTPSFGESNVQLNFLFFENEPIGFTVKLLINY